MAALWGALGRIGSIFRPRPTLSDEDVARGLRMMTREGMASMGFSSITTSGFLAAFALALGANNLQIGVLAAIPFIMQLLQIPTILLVEKVRRRKAIATITWFVAQLLWFPMALIPVLMGTPGGGAISMLLGLMALRGAVSAVTSCAWNGWVRDLVPQHILGRFYSRRLALSTVVAVVFGLGAAFFVDYWRGQASSESAVLGYTYVLLFGALFLGMASPIFMSFMPEPLMQSVTGPQPSLLKTLGIPLRDGNFRKLMSFLFFWGFASNLAIPFFAVYMLQRLGLSLTVVIALGVLSQLFNILFLRVWGPLADRFGSKAVLSLCVSLYLLVILGWTFTTMPEQYSLTIPLLVILHIFAGVAAAGVTLTVGTIGLKLAPQGQSTPYLAGASLASSLGAGLGPLAGGLFADFFRVRAVALDFTWIDPAQSIQLGIVHMTGFDFLFALAFLIGLVTLTILAALREEGEASRDVVLGELMTQAGETFHAVSSVPGLRFVGRFPLGYLRHIPGVDVALGVTAYQLADITRMATLAGAKARRAATGIARAVEDTLTHVVKPGEATSAQGTEIARQAARGVLHAVGEASVRNTERLIRPAVAGIVRALSRAHVDPQDTFRGLGYGLVQGAAEAGKDIGQTAMQAVDSARDAARAADVEEEEAAALAAEGALAAAEAVGPEAATEVRRVLYPETPSPGQ